MKHLKKKIFQTSMITKYANGKEKKTIWVSKKKIIMILSIVSFQSEV